MFTALLALCAPHTALMSQQGEPKGKQLLKSALRNRICYIRDNLKAYPSASR